MIIISLKFTTMQTMIIIKHRKLILFSLSFFFFFKFGFDLGGGGKGRGQMEGNGGISWIRMYDMKSIKNQ